MLDRKPIHFTKLSRIAISPAHYKWNLEHDEDSDAKQLGRCTHTTTLGGPPSVVWPGKTRHGKEWEAFKATHEGVDIFTTSQVTRATGMANAVMAHTHAARLLDCEKEKPVEWVHELGRRCATRGIDAINADQRYIVDLKTTSSVEPRKFRRAILAAAYHSQLAWYRDAARSLDVDIEEGYIIGVETKPPHVVTVFRLGPKVLEEGAKLSRLWMERLLAHEEADEWPGFVQDIIDLEMDDAVTLDIDGEVIDLEAA